MVLNKKKDWLSAFQLTRKVLKADLKADRATSKRRQPTTLLPREAKRELKKIAYVSFSEEMKSECIPIYIVRKVLNVASTPSENEE